MSMNGHQPIRTDTDDGALFFGALPPDSAVKGAVETAQTRADNRSDDTPVPEGDQPGGPVTRITDHVSSISARAIRHLVLTGAESAEAIRTRRDELYRNDFPLIRPRFAEKCTNCGREYDSAPDSGVCPDCGGDTRRPDPEQKVTARRLFESVNPSGQSLRDLAKRCEEDIWTAGVATIVIEHEYQQADGSGPYRAGEIFHERPVALHRADPLNCVPVVDESGQPGGYRWACPVHRDTLSESPGRCDCGAELRDVWFMDKSGSAGETPTPYFRGEVVTWAYAHPRLHGLDGISPSVHTWLRQSILKLMDRFGAAFYDPSSDRLPNQFYILHTSNPDAWEEEMKKAREDGDQYKSPIFTNEYSTNDSVQPEVEVIDGTPDELLGQNQDIKDDFKSDIRQAYGISDIHDSDLSDAGGLNNEGLQLEVTDRQIASQQHDYEHGWLDTLMKRLGFDEWRIEFLPERGPDAQDLQQHLRAAAFVQQAGGQARIVDGRIRVDDFEVDLDDSEDPPTLSGAPNLPGVGSPIPDEGTDPGADVGSDSPGGFGGLADTGPAETVTALERAGFSLAGIAQKAGPLVASDDEMPANAQRKVHDAIDEHNFHPVESASSADLERYFRKKLTQPQGWSMESLTRGLETEFDYDRADAKIVAREAVGVINRARQMAIEELEQTVDQQVLFYWDGPDDDGTTEICTWLKEQTNPEYDGDPVPMDELKDLQREAVHRYGDRGDTLSDPRDHFLHVGERHGIRSVLESEVGD